MKKLLLVLLSINPLLMAVDEDLDIAAQYEQNVRYRVPSRPPSRGMTKSPVAYLSKPRNLDEIDCDTLGCCIAGCCCTCGIYPIFKIIQKCMDQKNK